MKFREFACVHWKETLEWERIRVDYEVLPSASDLVASGSSSCNAVVLSSFRESAKFCEKARGSRHVEELRLDSERTRFLCVAAEATLRRETQLAPFRNSEVENARSSSSSLSRGVLLAPAQSELVKSHRVLQSYHRRPRESSPSFHLSRKLHLHLGPLAVTPLQTRQILFIKINTDYRSFLRLPSPPVHRCLAHSDQDAFPSIPSYRTHPAHSRRCYSLIFLPPQPLHRSASVPRQMLPCLSTLPFHRSASPILDNRNSGRRPSRRYGGIYDRVRKWCTRQEGSFPLQGLSNYQVDFSSCENVPQDRVPAVASHSDGRSGTTSEAEK